MMQKNTATPDAARIVGEIARMYDLEILVRISISPPSSFVL